MAIYFTSLIFYLLIMCFSILCFSNSFALSSSPTLVLNLLHPNHIYSRSYSEASVARLEYLQAKASGDIIANVLPYQPAAFLVNISIGNPPTMQLLHMDTASDLTWLQCSPCSNCYHQSIPIFNPERSSTYRNEFDSCRSYRYSVPSLHFNTKTRYCEYSIKYLDDSGSNGELVKETFTFNTIYGEFSTASLADVTFGCGHDNYGSPQVGTGVLGLGYGRHSLVRRFGSKFSYCFGSLDDPSYPHNVLVIGDDGADILGDTTPLVIDDHLYYVGMEGISVDGALLPIDPSVFQRSYQTRLLSGTIIDTGCSLTSLVREAYELLKNKIEDIFDGRFKTVYVHQHEKFKTECYSGDYERDLVESGFPIVTFHFSDGAELSLDVKSMFMKSDQPGIFCLTVTPTIADNLNIIGAVAQQNYNIGYDILAKTVSFERIDCGVLFDY